MLTAALTVSPQIWHHSFYQVLRAAPEQHPLLLTEPPSNSKASKERTAQVRGGAGGPGAAGPLVPLPATPSASPARTWTRR